MLDYMLGVNPGYQHDIRVGDRTNHPHQGGNPKGNVPGAFYRYRPFLVRCRVDICPLLPCTKSTTMIIIIPKQE